MSEQLDCEFCQDGGNLYQHDRDCCRARWVAKAMKAHADAMLDRWQMHDAVMIGAAKAKLRRKAVIDTAKQLKAGL